MIYKLNTKEGFNTLVANSTIDTISNYTFDFPWNRFINLFKTPIYITKSQIFDDIILEGSKRLSKRYAHNTKNYKTTKDIDFSEFIKDIELESNNYSNPIYLYKIYASTINIADHKTLQSSLKTFYTVRYIVGDTNIVRWMEDTIDIRENKYKDLLD